MRVRTWCVASVLAFLAASTVLLTASGERSGPEAAMQLRLADVLFEQANYRTAMGVYRRVAGHDDRELRTRGQIGTVRSALRIAEFRIAATHAATLRTLAPDDPMVLALSGDSFWASGLFEDAEASYRAALDRDAHSARALAGMAKVLASQGQLGEALANVEAAQRAAPRDPEIQATVGHIYQRLRRFDEAAGAYSNFLSLATPADREANASWVLSEINFLRSYSGKKPFELTGAPGIVRHTVPFRLVDEKVVVRAKLNDEEDVDFALDTGAEHTVVTAKTARRLGLRVMGNTLSAGVGEIGLRGMQISNLPSIQIGSLRVRNVKCLIKDPPLGKLPVGELESLSPLAWGMSFTVDYKNRRVTFGEPAASETPAQELPLRLHRLATVRGTVNGQPGSFVVDTGGQVISLNTSTARSIFRPAERRKIRIKVYGTSGVDPDAYLLPGIALAFDEISLPTQSVVVLNLRAPSVLLGYDIGGIIGHRFLTKYRVTFDLPRATLRLEQPL